MATTEFERGEVITSDWLNDVDALRYDNDGTQYVKHTPHTGTGAVVRTLQSKIRDYCVSVKDFGATGDGITDDRAAIQKAIDAVGAAGGGTILFPAPGSYYVGSSHPDSPSSHPTGLVIAYDYIHIKIETGARLWTDKDVYLIIHGGYCKPEGIGQFLTYEVSNSDNYSGSPFTLYNTNSASKGAFSITTTTASHAGNFSAGDWVCIRTGQTLGASHAQPMGEFNQVVSADSNTGVIRLKFPLRNDYTSENYPVGHPEAGNPAPFGIINCTTPHNVLLFGCRFDGGGRIENTSSTTKPLIAGNQIIGRVFKDLTLVAYGAVMSEGTSYSHMSDCNLFHEGTTYVNFIGVDKCNHGSIFSNLTLVSRSQAYIHVHEGPSAQFHNIYHYNTDPINSGYGISIGARAHDIIISNYYLIGYGANTNSRGISINDDVTDVLMENIYMDGIESSDAESIWVEDGAARVTLGNHNVDGDVFFEGGPESGNDITAGGLSIYIPAHDFSIQGGTPSLAWSGSTGTAQMWAFDGVSNETVGTTVKIPPQWKEWAFRVYWVNMTTDTGGVVWTGLIRQRSDGESMDNAVDTNTSITSTHASSDHNQWVVDVTAISNNFNTTREEGAYLQFLIQRTATHGSDTKTGDAGLIAVELVRRA